METVVTYLVVLQFDRFNFMKNIRIFITFLILALTITAVKADDLIPPSPPTIPPGTEGPTCSIEAIAYLNIRLAQLLTDPQYPQMQSQLNSFRIDLTEEEQILADYNSVFNLFYDPAVAQTLANNVTLLKAAIANLESDIRLIESEITRIQNDLIRCAIAPAPMPIAPPPTPVLVPVLIPDPVPTTMPTTTETEAGRPPVMVIPAL